MKKINDVANNMVDEVVQQECNNNKSYASAFIYIYTLLIIRQIQDGFSTSRNMLFKSSIKDMKIGPRNK